MTAACLIPARGGSRRIPRKNIVPFFGHPMLAYTIAAAVRSSLFRTVVVSTDDEEIAEVGARYGASVASRPAALANDTADIAAVALQFLDQEAPWADTLCVLLPNCPLRRATDVVDHHRAFVRERRRFQISAVRYRGVYPQWAMTRADDGAGAWLFGSRTVPSQQLGAPLCPTGAVWWADVEALRRERTFYGEPFHLEEIDANRGLDIDGPEDLALAELLVHGLAARDGASPLEAPARDPR